MTRDPERLIGWLDYATDGPHAFPLGTWLAFATHLEQVGHEATARRVRFEATERYLKQDRALLRRVWRSIKRYTIGHGYYPARALVGLGIVWLVALVTLRFSGQFMTPTDSALASGGTTASDPSQVGYPGFWAGLYAFDVVLAPVGSGQAEAWQVSGNEWLAGFITALRLAAYGLLGMFVTGVSGVLSKR